MADSYLNLTDLAKINDLSVSEAEVTDLLQDAPVLARLAAGVASNGTNHKYNKETGAPTVGFRDANAGTENSKSADTQVSIDLKILDGSFAVDKAVADAYRKGPEAYIAREMRRFLKAMFAYGEAALFNGVTSVFDGLKQALNDVSPNPGNIFDAGGATANAETSIYLIRTNADQSDCTVIGGNDGEGDSIKIAVGDSVVQRVEDSSGKHYPAYFTPIHSWLGLQIGGKYSVVRICNIASGTTINDELIYKGLELFPASRQPNLIVMNKNAQRRLRASRTATNATGAPAPRPTEVEGIPIVVTESILNTEAVVT